VEHEEYRQAAMTVRSRVLDVVRKTAALDPLPLLRLYMYECVYGYVNEYPYTYMDMRHTHIHTYVNAYPHTYMDM